MSHRPLASDTSADVERLQIEGWRQMSAVEKANLVRSLTAAALEMTLAGIRHRHPDESPDAHRRRLADILLGPELARRAFPESSG